MYGTSMTHLFYECQSIINVDYFLDRSNRRVLTTLFFFCLFHKIRATTNPEMTSNNKLPPTTAGISAENVQNPCVFNVFPFFKNAI